MNKKRNQDYPEYTHWKGMRSRCASPSIHKIRNKYKNISVCKEWDSFKTFYKDMGPKPFAKASIDRIDNTKDYTPDNCRWANDYDQARNTSRTVTYEYNGFVGCIPEIAEQVNVPAGTLYKGLQLGKTLEDVITMYLHDTKITYKGLSLTKAEWAEHLNIKRPTLYARFSRWGTDLERILEAPIKLHKKEET